MESVRYGAIGVATAEVHRFEGVGWDGRLVGAFGRRGQGPGEFDGPGQLVIAPDTLFVYDISYLHAFTPDGEALYSRRVRALRTRSGVLAVHAMAWTTQGIVAARRTFPPCSLKDGNRYADSLILYGRSHSSGEFVRTLARRSGRVYHRRGQLTILEWFRGTGEFGFLGDGRIVHADGDDYVLDLWGADETVVRRIRGSVPRRVGGEAERKAMLESAGGLQPPPGAEERSGADVLESVPSARWRAVLGRVLGGDDGTVLVERSDLAPVHPAPGTRVLTRSVWDLLDVRKGEVLGRVSLPADLEPLAFRGGKLYGTDHGGLIPVLTRYELRIP